MKEGKLLLERLFPRPWLIAWFLIYLVIIFCDLSTLFGWITSGHIYITLFKVSAIVLCFVYTFIYFRKDRLLQLAMLATCVADITLAINNTLVAGVEIFLIAQVLHLARQEWSRLEQPIVIVSLLAAICIILDSILDIMPLMYLVCFFYVIALVSNLLAAWRWCALSPQSPRALICFVGFTLFLCCDICTGLSYLSLNHILPFFLYAPANFFAWFFYYPSQVLISNSSKLPSRLKLTPPQNHNPKL